jgi:hypothetical protein
MTPLDAKSDKCASRDAYSSWTGHLRTVRAVIWQLRNTSDTHKGGERLHRALSLTARHRRTSTGMRRRQSNIHDL